MDMEISGNGVDIIQQFVAWDEAFCYDMWWDPETDQLMISRTVEGDDVEQIPLDEL